MDKKIYIDPRIDRVIERQIIRAHTHTHFWHQDLLPINRLFLFYGQPGSGLDEGVRKMLEGVTFRETTVSLNVEQVRADLTAPNDPNETPVLVLNNGHLLKYHRELYRHSLHLRELPYLFVLVLGEEVPDEEHAFYEQFDVKTVSGVPPIAFLRQLLEWYFEAWKRHWPHSEMQLTAEDLDWLASCSDYCTPRDVQLFTQGVFGHVVDRYPEETVHISRALLEDKNNGFMHESLGVAGILCITDRDARKLQYQFDPKGISDAPTVSEPRKKRIKTEVDIN